MFWSLVITIFFFVILMIKLLLIPSFVEYRFSQAVWAVVNFYRIIVKLPMTQVTPKLNNFFITLHTSESWQHFHFFLLILPQISFYYNLKERSIVTNAADTVVTQMIEVIAQVLFTGRSFNKLLQLTKHNIDQMETKSLQELLVRWCLLRTTACSNLTSYLTKLYLVVGKLSRNKLKNPR